MSEQITHETAFDSSEFTNPYEGLVVQENYDGGVRELQDGDVKALFMIDPLDQTPRNPVYIDVAYEGSDDRRMLQQLMSDRRDGMAVHLLKDTNPESDEMFVAVEELKKDEFYLLPVTKDEAFGVFEKPLDHIEAARV